MSLAVPLSSQQIDTAIALHDRLAGWKAKDTALALVAKRIPEFDFGASLIKVVAVNELYRTNLYAVSRMAEHVAATIQRADLATSVDTRMDPALVEQLAALPMKLGEQRARQFISFASKFAHFFIDQERFPIFDSYVKGMVDYHLGSHGRIVDPEHPYQAFVLNLKALKERAELTCSWIELDRYLWLAGLYRAWKRNPSSKINKEVLGIFDDLSSDVAAELAMLLPS